MSSGDKIIKNFEFENFSEAIKFVKKVARLAEEMNHHPDILIHDYKKVRVALTTHKAGKITEKDKMLADKISKIFENYKL